MSASIHTIDGQKLKAIANASPTAEVVMTSLALRERVRSQSDITRTRTNLIRDREKIVEADYMAFWESLEKAGVGSIHYPRPHEKDKSLKFNWHYSLKHIADAALHGKDVKASRLNILKADPKPLDKAPAKALPALKTELAKVTASKEIPISRSEKMVYVVLRPNFHVSIKVPSDFTKEESDVLYQALKSFSA